MTKITTRQGLIALSPIFVLIGLFLTLSIAWGNFDKVPLVVVFVIASAYALFITNKNHAAEMAVGKNNKPRKLSIADRVMVFSRGAGDKNLMMMLWIFILAGSFAQTAKDMGAIDSTVGLTLQLLPSSLLLPGLFLAACFVSLSIGTSVGTVVALVPMTSGIASSSGIALPLVAAAVVGGAFFGDNLSFISDTTIVATRTQGVKQSAKFRTNIYIAAPAALICFAIYYFLGNTGAPITQIPAVEFLKILPYLLVIVAAVMGLDVTLVLLMGNILSGIVGITTGSFGLEGWFASMSKGIGGMTDTILIALLAGGLMEVIRHNRGIQFIINSLTRHIHGKRGAEGVISALVAIINCVTANNTVAILAVGKISNEIAETYGVNKSKSASLLDTFSCVMQGLLPYGAQLLLAASLVKLSPVEILPHMYYNFVLAALAILSILLRYPRKFS